MISKIPASTKFYISYILLIIATAPTQIQVEEYVITWAMLSGMIFPISGIILDGDLTLHIWESDTIKYDDPKLEYMRELIRANNNAITPLQQIWNKVFNLIANSAFMSIAIMIGSTIYFLLLGKNHWWVALQLLTEIVVLAGLLLIVFKEYINDYLSKTSNEDRSATVKSFVARIVKQILGV